jgi:glyoxylase-like metal-dependent hydrolase (beta-lactamase superfamily II)
VRELEPGLWYWEAPHPDWEPSVPWHHTTVTSYAIDDGEHLLLFDPLAVPNELEGLAAEREPVIVLTCPWHERDARSLVERYGAPVFVPPPDEGSPDVAWLIAGDAGEPHLYSVGDRLPLGIEAFPGKEPNDLVLWVEERRAVVAGDTLVDFGRGFGVPVEWLGEDVTREQVVEGLRPLLELPVEHVLATHGGPAERRDLERALS